MTHTRQTGRKRFPKWLRELVDKGEVSGVYWLDEGKTIFRVPWTRVDSPEFDLAKDAMLFQRWAEFTGRYRVGERTDPSVWKTRFRCAIRKMSEIKELTVATNLEDKSGSQPFRVFRFTKEVQIISKRKDTKRVKSCNKVQKPLNNSRSLSAIKYQVPSTKYHGKTSRVTGQGMVRDATCGRTKSVTKSWMNRGIVAHGVTQMPQMLPNNLTNGVTVDGLQRCVTANEVTDGDPREKCWPIINGANISHSSSYEITVSDLSLQQHINRFEIQYPIPDRDCVTMDPQFAYNTAPYCYDNDDLTSCEMMRRASEQPCLPNISLQEVNSVLQSCSDAHCLSQDEQRPSSIHVGRRQRGVMTQTQVNGIHSFFGEESGNNLSTEVLKLGIGGDCQETKACSSDLNDLTEILGLYKSIDGDVICE